MMLARLAAFAAWTLVIAGTAYAQGTNAGAGRPRSNAGSTGGARPQAPQSAAPPRRRPYRRPAARRSCPAPGLIVAPEDGARPPRPRGVAGHACQPERPQKAPTQTCRPVGGQSKA